MRRVIRHEAVMAIENPMQTKPKRPFVAWVLLAAGAVERIVGWGGSIDFLLSRWNEPAWVGKVLSVIQQYSNILGLVAFFVGIAALIRHERKRNQYLYGLASSLRDNAAPPEPVTVESSDGIIDSLPFNAQSEARSLIYVGSATVHIARMSEENRAELAIIAFNGYDFPVKITPPRNYIRMSYQTSESETGEEVLSTPILLTDRSPIVAESRSEFMIVLHQYLTQSQIATINSALDISHVTFNLKDLEIYLESEDGNGVLFRIPFIRSPNVSLAKEGEYKNNYTIFLRASAIIGAPDSSPR